MRHGCLTDETMPIIFHAVHMPPPLLVVPVIAGQSVLGSVEAGLRIAEICMGGLGKVSLAQAEATRPWRWQILVHSSNPVIACLGSQYAGWDLSHGKGETAYCVLGSGPGRAIVQKEGIFLLKLQSESPF